jgi:hypothetical protein
MTTDENERATPGTLETTNEDILSIIRDILSDLASSNDEHDGEHKKHNAKHKEHRNISKMYFCHWKSPGVSERMWSVNLDASILGEYQSLGGHSGWPSE